jgi:predicted nucleic acid-binding protein
MSAPIALLDANVLYDVVLRDLLMQLASSGLFRARWTARINDEWTRNLLANRSDLSAAQLEFTKAMMARAVPNGLVERYEALIDTLQLPDPDDRHVLAAAITAEADVIITLNLKDFPREALLPYGIEPLSPDSFLTIMNKVAPEAVIASARKCLARLINPPLSVEQYLTVLARHGLSNTVAELRTLMEG